MGVEDTTPSQSVVEILCRYLSLSDLCFETAKRLWQTRHRCKRLKCLLSPSTAMNLYILKQYSINENRISYSYHWVTLTERPRYIMVLCVEVTIIWSKVNDLSPSLSCIYLLPLIP